MRRHLAAVLAVLAAAAALTACGGASKGGGPAAPQQHLQTIRFQQPEQTGPNPFMPPVDVAGHRTVPVSDSTQPFGGSGSNRVCDRNKLIRFLSTHQGQMLAWASVLHVEPSLRAVKRYIAKLHPVTLTRDTRVTNHGFSEQKGVFAFQAILKAGTAVLVDRYGRPVVRCFCGNPLGPAVFTTASRCIDCPARYKPPRQCEFARGDDYDTLYYRRSYYDNQSYDEVYIRLQRRSHYRGCYRAYPDPPTVTIVAVYHPPPATPPPTAVSTPAPGTTPPSDSGGLHCNPPRSQLEFEQCSGMGDQPQQPSSPSPSPSPAPQHQPTPTPTDPNAGLPQVGECNNGVDDDGDGLVDTADPGCSGPNDQSEG
jgi:hypothetical protein